MEVVILVNQINNRVLDYLDNQILIKIIINNKDNLDKIINNKIKVVYFHSIKINLINQINKIKIHLFLDKIKIIKVFIFYKI